MTIMKLYTRVSQVLVLLVALCAIGFLAISPAHAASPASQTSPANCYIRLVHLHGENPATVECKVSGTMVNGHMVPTAPLPQESVGGGRIKPSINYANCDEWFGAAAEIDSATEGRWCFDNSGYMGFPMINNVTGVHGNYDGGWVMVYKNGSAGFKFGFSSGTWTHGPLFDGGSVGITQINLY